MPFHELTFAPSPQSWGLVAPPGMTPDENKPQPTNLMAKIRSITLTEIESGAKYQVVSFTNTAQLSCGQIVGHDRLEYWSTLPDVRFKVLPAPREEETDLDESSQQEISRVSVESEFEVEPCGVQTDAREFDRIMLENAGPRDWGTESQTDTASQPDPGTENLGSGGIALRVGRAGALAIIRRNCVRDLGGDFENAGQLSVRAGLLSTLKNFVFAPLPF